MTPPYAFWRRLFNYRDKKDPNPADLASAVLPDQEWYADSIAKPSGRRATTGITGVRDTNQPWPPPAGQFPDSLAYVGFEQLAEVCNIQLGKDPQSGNPDPTFDAFWQDPLNDAVFGRNAKLDPLLPQQYMRKLAGNFNRLTTRSDSYMVTVRVEIVRPTWKDLNNDGLMQLNEITRVDILGHRQYAYLVDRSVCTQPPQLGGTLANGFNGTYNTDFIAPRSWRSPQPTGVGR